MVIDALFRVGHRLAWIAFFLATLCPGGNGSAQTINLGLSSASVNPGGTVSLTVSAVTSGTPPAALQWTFSYPATQISVRGVSTGAAAASAGKTVSCSSLASGLITCVLAGPNANPIVSGIAANIQLSVPATGVTTPLAITNSVGVSGAGSVLAVSQTGGNVVVPAISSVACTPGGLNINAASTCTLTLNSAAPAGGAPVAITSNQSSLAVPATVTVAAGATTANFNATAGTSIASDLTATITATYGASIQTAVVNLLGPRVLSIGCVPSNLGPGQASTCIVTLTENAPTGGSSVTLASDNALLTVSPVVSVAAGASTATFNVMAAAVIPLSQTATITATLAASSRSASLSLAAPAAVSGLTCNPSVIGQSGTASCILTLTQNAPSGGASVALTSDNTLLSVPPAITVAGGANTGVFSAIASANIGSDQSAHITATLAGSVTSTTISLRGVTGISSLVCNPAVLAAGGSSSCTVSLSQAPPPVVLVNVTSCGPQAFPATCTIPATASGNLLVVGFQTGNGVLQTTTIASVTDNAGNTFAAAPSARSFDSVAGAFADVWYARNALPGATALTITSNNAIPGASAVIWEFAGADLSTPLEGEAAAGNQSGTTSAAGAPGTAVNAGDLVISLATANTVTGIAGGNSFVEDGTVQGQGWAHLITSSPGAWSAQWSLSAASTYASSTVVFKAAGSVTLTTDNPSLSVPASVTVPLLATAATFSATAAASIPSAQTATITAKLGNSSQTTAISLTATGTGGGGGTLTVSPQSITFNVAPNSVASQTLALTYRNTNNVAPTFQAIATLATGNGWLSVSPATAPMNFVSFDGSIYTFSSTITITVNGKRLTGPITLTGSVNFSLPGVSASANVIMNLTSPGKLSAAPQTLSFRGTQGDPSELIQTISVFSQASGASVTAVASSDTNWLSVGAGGTTPGTLAVSTKATGLAAGTAAGQVTISNGDSAVVVPVTFVVAGAAPQLSISPDNQIFMLSQGGVAEYGQVTVSNSGGGTLQFTANSDPGSASWLKLTSGGTGSATPSAPASVGFTVNQTGLTPGLYRGQITVEDSNSASQAVATVSLAVSQAPQLTLSQTGLIFSANAGGAAPPPQSFTVATQGSGTVSWTAQTADSSGSPPAWLSVSPSSWSSGSGRTGSPVAVTVNPAGLAAGKYFGTVEIVSSGAANSPQSVLVVLNVAAMGDAGVNIGLSSGSVLLRGSAGNTAPIQQQISVFNPSDTTLNYVTAVPAPGNGWLAILPATGQFPPGSTTISIVANLAAVPAGTQTATAGLGLDSGTPVVLQATVISSGGASANAAIQPRLIGGTPCQNGQPGYLVPVFRQPMSSALLQVAVPQTVQLQITDDCGTPLSVANGGAAQISFGDGDASMDVHDIGGGIWEGTWTPVKTSATVLLKAIAYSQSPLLSSIAASTTANVQPASLQSPAQVAAVLSAATSSILQPQVVAPGEYVAVYGTNLAAADGQALATTIPLPQDLNGARLLIGGKQVPLVYAGPNQVNAVIPQDLNLNTSYQLLVLRDSMVSAPISLTTTAYQPGIYTADFSGGGQGIVEIAGTAMLAGPVGSGSKPVKRGSEYLSIFATGFGTVTGANGEPPPSDGAAGSATTLYRTTATVTATLGGVDVPVTFAGLTPSLVALYQINVQVLSTVPTGDAVPLVLTVADPVTGKTIGSNTVTVAVQ